MLEDLPLQLLEEESRELTMKEADLLQQLTEIRAAKQRVNEKKNSYAPIFTLPDELLASIVLEARKYKDPASIPFQVIVSHVSRRFRWAVIGAASLWSSIKLRWGVESDEERLAVYLARSRSYPLSIQLNWNEILYYGEREPYDKIRNELATVAPHVFRIRRLVLHCDGLGLPRRDAVMLFEDLHAPCLEYLEICSHADERASDITRRSTLSIFRGGAPRLSTLKMNNVYPTLSMTAGNSNPWLSVLTRLDFRGMLTRGGIHPNLLANCPQLIDLTLDDSTFFFVPAPNRPIPMPSLRCFRALGLDNQSDSALIGILSDIDAPALENLQFSGLHINSSKIASLVNFLSPPKFPILKSLTFANPNVDQVCFGCAPGRIPIDVLQRFPTLESLTAVNICDMDVLMADLLAVFADAEGARSCALPSLRAVTLRYKDDDEFGNACWPSLSSSGGSLPTPDPLHGLQRLIAALRRLRPIRLRLPRSRFFTEHDWDSRDANFETFDVDQLLQSLSYSGENYSSHSSVF